MVLRTGGKGHLLLRKQICADCEVVVTPLVRQCPQIMTVKHPSASQVPVNESRQGGHMRPGWKATPCQHICQYQAIPPSLHGAALLAHIRKTAGLRNPQRTLEHRALVCTCMQIRLKLPHPQRPLRPHPLASEQT